MKTLNFVRMLLMSVVLLGLTSCGEENYYLMQNSDEKLCGKTWVEEYTTEGNDFCRHQLKFTRDYSGRETFFYYRKGESRPYQEKSFAFNWRWMDASMENLEMNYGAGDVIYFDNVWTRDHNLSGKLDGVHVTFVDANYYN